MSWKTTESTKRHQVLRCVCEDQYLSRGIKDRNLQTEVTIDNS